MSTEDPESGKKSNGIADEDGLTRARTRVSRACTRCRSRKDKCDGQRPSCSTCVSAHQTCSYEPATKKRGLPEGYVRGLEKLWSVLIHRINGLEDAVVRILNDDQHSLLQVWNQHTTGEELHSMWKESRILQELENLLAGLDHSSSKRKRDREDEDEDDTPNSTVELDNCLRPQFDVKSAQSTGFGVMATLPSTSSKLLTHYFTYTHSWLPILDRPLMLKRCYEFSKSEVSFEGANPDLAVLCAVLAYTSQQVNGSDPSLHSSSNISPEVLSSMSRKCIPSTEGHFAIGHVQALLLLVLLDIGFGRWNSAWITIGFAVRIMPQLTNSTTGGARAEAATFQGCFILDTLVALRLSRRPQFHRAEVDSRSLLQEDGHEEWEPWTGPNSDVWDQREPAFSISCFNRLTELFMILNDCVNNPEPNGTQSGFFEEKMGELNALSEKYPFSISDTSARPPHQIWLQLSHLSAMAYIAWRGAGNATTLEKGLSWTNSLLDLCSRTTAIGLQNLPTLLSGLLQPLCKNLLVSSQGRPPTMISIALEKFADLLTQASKTWPENETLIQILRETPTMTSGRNVSQVGETSSNKRRKMTSQDFGSIQPTQSQLSLWPSGPFAYSYPSDGNFSSAPLSIPTALSGTDDFSHTYGVARSSINFAVDSDTSASVVGSYGTMKLGTQDSMNLDGLSVNQSIPGGISMPSVATSPSFQGDEIDALFHEMAQLDTTEWTSGRTQGLKDFGFSDDLTFEAFCNDPDRLTSSNTFDQQAFGDPGSVSTQGYPPPNILQPHARNASNSLDILTASWNG